MNSNFFSNVVGHVIVFGTIMSGRAVLSDVGSSHTLEVKTTDVTVTRQAHFESSKTSPLVCDCVFIIFKCC